MLKTPTQASDIFGQSGYLPKQKHVFLVNFIPGFKHAAKLGDCSFVVKNIDRPSIEMTVETINQYNKKRQVQTGYKTTPIKMTFWDSALGEAVKLYRNYCAYYYGDFDQSYDSYKDDVVFPDFKDQAKKGFGYTAYNGGNTTPDGKFYLNKIEILHIYSQTYDRYTLYNPKFTSFIPDEFDYGDANINTISATVSYEALHIETQVGPSSTLPQFQLTSNDGDFNGQAFHIPGTETAISPMPVGAAIAQIVDPSLEALFGGVGSTPLPESFRYNSGNTGGILGLFGGFSFGLGASFGIGASLSATVGGNAGLGAILGLSVGANVGVNFDSSSSNIATPPGYDLPGTGLNIPTSLYNNVEATAQGAFGANLSDAGAAVNAVTLGVAGASVVAGAPAGLVNGDGGVTLSPTAYGLINASGNGAAQYGLNTQAAPFAMQLGFTNVPSQTVSFPDPSNNDTTPAGTTAALGASLTNIAGTALPASASPSYATVTAIPVVPTPATSLTALSTVGKASSPTGVSGASLTTVTTSPDFKVTRNPTSQTVKQTVTAIIADPTTGTQVAPVIPGVTVIYPSSSDLTNNDVVGTVPVNPPPTDTPDVDVPTTDLPYSD